MTDPAPSLPGPFVHRALLHEPGDRGVRCLTCERRCDITSGAVGWCQTRQNQDGVLVTLIYGAVSSLAANPIEKKPFYHFHPGSLALTSGSWSCNFGCPWCQNHRISKMSGGQDGWLDMSPEDFVAEAISLECRGTSISFNEPTLSLEWSLDVFRLARTRGLYNTFVSNGYMTSRALELLAEAGLDAMNIDIKGDAATLQRYGVGIDVEKVWRNCRLARQLGVHLEVTTLVIPGANDGDGALRGIAERIGTELGKDVPWHLTGYRPAHRFTAPPTPVPILERAWHVAKEAGLAYVYVGNVPGHRLENTCCPDCQALLIRRWGLNVTSYRLDHGRCPRCERPVPGIWPVPAAPRPGREESSPY